VLGLVQGHSDEPVLTEVGRQQAEEAVKPFLDRAISVIYASDLRRAQQTAEIFQTALGVTITTDPALRERCFGVNEGLPLSAQRPEKVGISGDRIVSVHARPDGGESLEDLYRRVVAFVDRLQARSHQGEVIVITHGGTIRALRAYCSGADFADVRWDDVSNASAWPVRLPVAAGTQSIHL
jgi:broad specificity phosphatase PhoE